VFQNGYSCSLFKEKKMLKALSFVGIILTISSVSAVFAAEKKPIQPKPSSETLCKVFDITKGDLRFTERKFSEIVSIKGGISDGLTGSDDVYYSYKGGDTLPKNHPLMNTRRYEYFPPLAILFQPTGEQMQVVEIGKTFKPSNLVFTSNLNAIVLADQRRGKRLRLDPIFDQSPQSGVAPLDPLRLRPDLLGPNKKPNYTMYFPVFKSTELGTTKNVNLEICVR
jgi:hypothetical protein